MRLDVGRWRCISVRMSTVGGGGGGGGSVEQSVGVRNCSQIRMPNYRDVTGTLGEHYLIRWRLASGRNGQGSSSAS